MHRIGVVGISWRDRRASAVAALTIPREERAGRIPGLARAVEVAELVYIATCNRVEVAFATGGTTPLGDYRQRIYTALLGRPVHPGEAEHTLRIWQGEGAIEHLFLVAAGLDSARIGESEVTGQIREAADLATELGLLGPRLGPLFTEALRVARRVRPITEGRVGKVSLAQIAVRRVQERLRRTPGAVALVGVSPMTVECARQLAVEQVPSIIVNRTLAHAVTAARDVGAEHCALDAFREAPLPVEALIVATGAALPIFTRGDLERIAARTLSGESPLVIDFSVPPNVTPEDAAAADIPRLGMEEITEDAAVEREQLLGEFADARAIVDDALTEFRRQTAERLVGPMIAELRRRYRTTAVEGVARLLEKDLPGMGESEREAILRWAETLARRFAHVPSVGLRELAFRVGPGAVEAFFEGADPSLARDLHRAAELAGIDGLADPELEEV